MATLTNIKKNVALIFILTILVMPFSTALQISNVHAEQITPNGATIAWTTDESADSVVQYGDSPAVSQTTGDARQVQEHRVELRNLQTDALYYYDVQSSAVRDTNDGNHYTFVTLPPDTTPPTITTTIPTVVQGATLSLTGTTEAGVQVKIFVENVLVKTLTADTNGSFSADIPLQENRVNHIRLEATDAAGNTAAQEGTVLADNRPPVLTVKPIPESLNESLVIVEGTVSENSSITILLDDRSVKEFTGTSFSEQVQLNEGKNTITITARDRAGFETAQEFIVASDTQPPRVTFEFTHGTEYYEGRAETDITGETEPGAAVYLFIFRSQTTERNADFKRAVEKVTAGDNGEFKFSKVEFPPPVFTSLKELAPREVPSGLVDVTVPALSESAQEQRKSYQVYLIAEDAVGRTGYAQKSVNVNTCFSGNFAFDITPIPQFQAPYRLDPGLMEEGRETIQTVFNLTYRGSGATTDSTASAGFVTPGFDSSFGGYTADQGPYRLSQVPRFEKACTRDVANNNDYELGCKLLGNINVQPNPDKTAFYVTAPLQAANEFLDKEDNVWDDFVRKRQLKFPIKILINYQEKEPTGAWGPVQSQVYCTDLGYFVDRPIDSEKLVPDFLAEDGVKAINETINAIEKVKPYLRTAIIVSGVSCVGSFLTKMTVRFYRIFMSNFESWIRRAAALTSDEEPCPSSVEQYGLYLESTIDHWAELSSKGMSVHVPDKETKSLDKLCPQTAKAWKLETFFDKAYRYTCDRFFCRAVPAGWTETVQQKSEIDAVIIEQQQCMASSQCAPLVKIENCQERVKKNPITTTLVERTDKPFTCWQDADGTLYYHCVKGDPSNTCEKSEELEQKNVWLLRPISEIGVYKPLLYASVPGLSSPGLSNNPIKGADAPCVAIDKTCKNVCNQKKGYIPAKDGYVIGTITGPQMIETAGGCYKEDAKGSLLSQDSQKISGTKLQAGYTRDCFINPEQPQDRYQCVCEEDKRTTVPKLVGAREANAKDETTGVAEEWVYQQSRVYEESSRTAGTYYPEWRYYSGRDFSAAFGQNWLFDNFKDKDFAETKVDPHTQHAGAFQSACLPGINARLTALQSILIGVKDCIERAQYTGEFDVGQCKALFTQYVCGMIYKGVAYLGSGCSPISLKDVTGVDGDDQTIRAFFDSGFKAIPQAIETSIQEIKSDYGNAKLNEFFAAGTQGFAESICLAAFGFDFPMGMDFIEDAAYSFPMKTSALIFPAERELATFNPVKGTATYNYNVGISIVPGCKIRSYRTELKCIGIEDMPHPGIDCSRQQCDCLRTANQRPELSNERAYLVNGGSGFTDLPQHQRFEFPIETPQRISSSYRYDHVVVELTLDPNEDPAQCFDEGYRTANGGKFYYPITDTSAPGIAQCSVDPTSGRFICPQLTGLFGGSQSYFEFPYVECYNKKTEEFVNCETPNLFLLRDEIVIKPYLYVGGDEVCLRLKDREGEIINTFPLPSGFQGPYAPRLPVATVKQNMIAGGGTGTIRAIGNDASSCGGVGGDVEITQFPSYSNSIQQTTMIFRYTSAGSGKYTVQVEPQGSISVNPINGYSLLSGTLQKNSVSQLTIAEINAAEFQIAGFTFRKIFSGSLTSARGQCTFQVVPPGANVAGTNAGSYDIKLELLKKDENAGTSCIGAVDVLPSSPQGVTVVSKRIRVQAQAEEVRIAQNIYDDFQAKNYNLVEQKARAVIEREEPDLDDAIARFYWVASLVARSESVPNAGTPKMQAYRTEIYSLLDGFFDNEASPIGYTTKATATAEYQKVKAYLCEIDLQLDKKYRYSTSSSINCEGYVTLCGSTDASKLNPLFTSSLATPPTNWENYVCRDFTTAETASCYEANCVGSSCKAQNNYYVPPDKFKNNLWQLYGCPGTQRCCPKS